MLNERGYQVALNGEVQWNGVAVVSKVGLDDVVAGIPDGPGWMAHSREAVAVTTSSVGW